jgi:prophage regulatory protein
MTQLLRLPDVMARTGLSRSRVYELLHAGEFPQPAKIGRLNLWAEHELDQFITARLNAREAA